jgi:hypothetical protein
MKWLLLIAAFVELMSVPAYAHGEQVAYVFYSDALVIVGWVCFLFIYQAPAFHKIAIFAMVLLTILTSWLLIEYWYLPVVAHPIIVSLGFAAFHTLAGVFVLILLRKLVRSEDGR